jgi:hypothetical protein
VLATSGDNATGLRGTMCRAELINFLIRLAKTWQLLDGYEGKRKLSDNLNYFFTIYLYPLAESSVIIE